MLLMHPQRALNSSGCHIHHTSLWFIICLSNRDLGCSLSILQMADAQSTPVESINEGKVLSVVFTYPTVPNAECALRLQGKFNMHNGRLAKPDTSGDHMGNQRQWPQYM